MKLSVWGIVVGAVEGASFSAWQDLSCLGNQTASSKVTTPYTCYYVGSSVSILAMGLDGLGKDMYKVFSDTRCKDQAGVVKYNSLCSNYNFLSVALFPSTGAKARELISPSDPVESRMQEMLLKLDGHMPDSETMSTWWPISSVAYNYPNRVLDDHHSRDDISYVDDLDKDGIHAY